MSTERLKIPAKIQIDLLFFSTKDFKKSIKILTKYTYILLTNFTDYDIIIS